MSDPLITLKKLSTSEDEGQQEELVLIDQADELAREIMLGGVMLSDEATSARLYETLDQLAGYKLSDRLCESGGEVAHDRARNAFYIGLTTGIRFARATDGGAATE